MLRWEQKEAAYANSMQQHMNSLNARTQVLGELQRMKSQSVAENIERLRRVKVS